MSESFEQEKLKDFTVIRNSIFKDYTLSAKAKGVACQLLSLPPTWDYSVRGLVELFDDGEASIRSALAELEEHGYLRRERERNQGKLGKSRYIITDMLKCEKPNVEKPHEVKPHEVNHAQLNTKESITKESNTKSSSLRSEDIYEGLSENLISALKDFEEMRKKIKAPMTDRAKTSLVKKLDRLAGDNEELKIQMLDEAILHNWKSVYPLKETDNGRTENDTRRSDPKRTRVERATDRGNYDYAADAAKLPGMVFGISQEE